MHHGQILQPQLIQTTDFINCFRNEVKSDSGHCFTISACGFFGKLKKLYAENDEDEENENKSVTFKIIIAVLSLFALAILVFIIWKILH